jgi:hypothetical protein
MIDVEKNIGAIVGWTVAVITGVIILFACPALFMLIAGIVLLTFSIAG